MNSRERVVTVLNRGVPDRVPVDYSSNEDIDRRLKQHFGLAAADGEGLLRALGVDFHGIGPRFVGPSRHADIPARGIKVDAWGMRRRWVAHPSGGYWDYCDFPLAEATEEQVAAWPMPSPDDYDYRGVASECRRLRAYALHAGGAGTGDVINSNGMLRGMEQTLIDLVTDDPAGLLLADRLLELSRSFGKVLRPAFQGRARPGIPRQQSPSIQVCEVRIGSFCRVRHSFQTSSSRS